MRGQWRIGRIMGIDIAIDWSWFLIAFLMVYSLGFLQFPRELHPRALYARADAVSVALGIGATLLLFASVLAHELSHSWMAIQRGIPVVRITLFVFGGVAQIADEPDRPASEFLIAIMGPLMSGALAALFGAAWLWLRILNEWLASGPPVLPFVLLMGILFQANAALALFNLAPGFPLDGGRVLRAALWGSLHDVRRATRWASRTGQALALLMTGGGIWLFVTDLNGAGIWYALIGLFLWTAAGEAYRQTVLRESLRDVRVGQLMTREVETVGPDLTLADFVQHVLSRREQTFAVLDSSGLRGTVSSGSVHRVPRSEWATRRVADVMQPRAQLHPLEPEQSAAAALACLSGTDDEELPVLDAGELIGFLGRAQVARFLRLKLEPKGR